MLNDPIAIFRVKTGRNEIRENTDRNNGFVPIEMMP